MCAPLLFGEICCLKTCTVGRVTAVFRRLLVYCWRKGQCKACCTQFAETLAGGGLDSIGPCDGSINWCTHTFISTRMRAALVQSRRHSSCLDVLYNIYIYIYMFHKGFASFAYVAVRYISLSFRLLVQKRLCVIEQSKLHLVLHSYQVLH